MKPKQERIEKIEIIGTFEEGIKSKADMGHIIQLAEIINILIDRVSSLEEQGRENGR